uniref:Uncharacterized protein n=1 Tax=Engystomops pustulosus TaxID=76066 RepID=A0AAV6Z0A8_ENGPU|nr:hypothetical protein GDO81_025579 [Engystomops pustulosus]
MVKCPLYRHKNTNVGRYLCRTSSSCSCYLYSVDMRYVWPTPLHTATHRLTSSHCMLKLPTGHHPWAEFLKLLSQLICDPFCTHISHICPT